jgi:lysophospholipase L1-like esterase
MRVLLPFAALALAAASAPAPLPVTVGGRVLPEADGSLSFGWPGVYFEGRFRGQAVRVRFVADSDFLRLLIDGREVKRWEHPGAVDAVIDGLAPGDHVVRLEKLTESQQGGSRFIGFYPAEGSTPLSARAPTREIEFIGDSYTVGYGNTSPATTCSRDAVHDLTDTQQAFGPLVARHYDADYRINAYSGIGVVRNYAGGSPEMDLPKIYHRMSPDDAVNADRGGNWRPSVIVVNLGTNDFSTPVHPGERWADEAALHADYRARYVAFVRDLAAHQPQAHFVLMGAANFYPDVEAVAAALDADQPDLATPLLFDGLAHTACDFHPSLADDRRMAGLIESVVDRIVPGWATKQTGETQ